MAAQIVFFHFHISLIKGNRSRYTIVLKGFLLYARKLMSIIKERFVCSFEVRRDALQDVDYDFKKNFFASFIK